MFSFWSYNPFWQIPFQLKEGSTIDQIVFYVILSFKQLVSPWEIIS